MDNEIVKLFICSYVIYKDSKDALTVDQISSFSILAYDYNEALDTAKDSLKRNFPDQIYDFNILILPKESYSKVFLMNTVNDIYKA